MAKNKVRKYSGCQNLGHTKKTPKKSAVFVQITENAEKSPYVVDLRPKKKEEDILAIAPVYSETAASKKIGLETMDLTQIIREKNKELALAESVHNANFLLQKIRTDHAIKLKDQTKQINLIVKEEARDIKRAIREAKKMEFRPPFRAVDMLQKFMANFSFKRFAYQSVALILAITTIFPAVGYYNRLKAVEEVIVEQGTDGFMALQASTLAAFQSNLGQAEEQLTDALQSFASANSVIDNDLKMILSVIKLFPIVGTQVSSRQNLLTAGSHLALGNTYFIKGIRETQNNKDIPLTDRLDILRNHLRSALPQYNEALHYLNQVEINSIPVDYQKTFTEFKVLFGAFINDMIDLVDLSRALNTIFGDDSFRRYLVVFQNNHELRPTGGFMGSFAIVDVQKGKILNIEVPGGGTYDLRGQLTQFVKPPVPLQLLNKRWEFQDANWFPDFAASAQKMEWFYENGRSATVDGVIAVNASVLERVLKVLGPVEAGRLLFDQNDALEKLQYKVEVDYDKKTEQPKEVLAEVLNQLMLSFGDLKSADIMNLLTELHAALQQKELQVYMNSEPAQKQLRLFGWTGEILPTQDGQDYLSVIHTNIQGQKSDAKISQTINHEAVVDEDGNVIDTVVIERVHTGTPGEQFYGGLNISYVRVYVPEGVELVSAGGFSYPPEDAFRVPEEWYENDKDLQNLEKEVGINVETGTHITTEFGKTVFGNWVITPPGQTSTIYFRYKLPFKVQFNKLPEENLSKWKNLFVPALEKQTSHYSLLAQKQSGINSKFSTTMIYPSGWMPVWKSKDEIDLALNGARYETILKTDETIGIVLEKEFKE